MAEDIEVEKCGTEDRWLGVLLVAEIVLLFTAVIYWAILT